MNTRAFSPGFRFSKSDAFVLFIGGYISADTACVEPWLGIAMGFVIAHFFLFCNFVRMARSSELAWAGIFVLLAASTILLGQPQWPVTLAISLVATVALVVLEMRKPSYHGVLWRRINPGLPQWWDEQVANGHSLAPGTEAPR